MSDLVIRPMSRADLDRALDWAAAEGWNPGLDDADAFLAADPGGFLIGRIHEEPIACISVVSYGEAYGFLVIGGTDHGFCAVSAEDLFDFGGFLCDGCRMPVGLDEQYGFGIARQADLGEIFYALQRAAIEEFQRARNDFCGDDG